MQYNVFLSGGGMKGAYQYGFFKELYVRWPDFPIKKVYAVSVGAMNSVPIVTRRMDALDKYWCNQDTLHPFDTIADDWEDFNGFTPAIKVEIDGFIKWSKPAKRFGALFKYGSMFKRVKREPYETFLKDIDAEGWHSLKTKLVIISYDKVARKSIYTQSSTIEEIVDSIQASTRFPGLFDVSDEINVDGTFANISHMLTHEHNEKWLCLYLQNTLHSKFKKCASIYYPKIANVPILNEAACLLSNRHMLDSFIINGKQDAKAFVSVAMNCHLKHEYLQ